MFCRCLLYCLLLCTPSMLFAKKSVDSLTLAKVFARQENIQKIQEPFTANIYVKHYYHTEQRNFSLWLIPSMHAIAEGEREFISETIYKADIRQDELPEYDCMAYHSTIPHNRLVMTITEMLFLPTFHNTTLYGKQILSPLCKENRRYYKYEMTGDSRHEAKLHFRPRLMPSTQLIKGVATVDRATGRVLSIEYAGEYDMVEFKTKISYADETSLSPHYLPKDCHTDIKFNFIGNRVHSDFTVIYDIPVPDIDSLSVQADRNPFNDIRPIALNEKEKDIYMLRDSSHTQSDSIPTKKRNRLTKIGSDVGEHLVSSHSAQNKDYYLKASPIIHPQHLTYSHSKGISYKMKFTGELFLTSNARLSLMPTLGYNFKIKQFYYHAPLRYTYDSKRNNYLELSWSNGNRIGNSAVLDEIEKETGKNSELGGKELDLFDDNQLRMSSQYQVLKWLRTDIGIVYHRRSSANKKNMSSYGKPVVYRSLAPNIGITVTPWRNGPTLSLEYEQGIKNKAFELDYERWEGSASMKFLLPRTQLINTQIGGGFYSRRRNNYFMDYSNFCENNLPGGWEDDWSGDFQLLNSRLYNTSRYYLNTNISYDSPLLLCSLVPLIGRHIERERLYWSGLLIQHSRPYAEIGYGLSTRFFAAGVFASFHCLEIQRIGAKFTFELFHKW